MVNGESHTNVHILELVLLIYLLPIDTEMPSKQAITGVAACVVVMSRQGKGRRGDTNPRPKSIYQVPDGKDLRADPNCR